MPPCFQTYTCALDPRMRSRSSPCSPVMSASAMTSAVTPTATPEHRDQRDERDERLLPLRKQVAPGDVEFEGHGIALRLRAPGSRLRGCQGSSRLRLQASHVNGTSCCTRHSMSRNHEKLRVFQLADTLALTVYRHTACFPATERYGLQSQLRRAAISVATNIVEGCARRSRADYARFLDIALGSATETDYLLGPLPQARRTWRRAVCGVQDLRESDSCRHCRNCCSR